jgi:hypothetical protein
MSASENRKDELAARALSRLPDPPLPEGLAARIAARATAVPQIGIVASGRPSAAVSPLVEDAPLVEVAPLMEPERSSRRRWPFYAAASVAAAALLLVGIFAGADDRPASAPALAEEEAIAPLQQVQQRPVPAEFVDAAPRAPKAAHSTGRILPAADPKMVLPVPVPTPPAELASDDKPAEAPKPVEAGNQLERLAQTRPQAGPQAPPQSGSISIPVYGPPAPTGLGIAGSVGSATAFPGETGNESRSPRSAPTGPPPSNLPGPSTPRGPGPRR